MVLVIVQPNQQTHARQKIKSNITGQLHIKGVLREIYHEIHHDNGEQRHQHHT